MEEHAMKMGLLLALAISVLSVLALAQSGAGAQDKGKKATKNVARITRATWDNTGQHPGSSGSFSTMTIARLSVVP
jgi:hypothetical protein